jgi:hypothetical protein
MNLLNELIADHELYHSEFQMDSLITLRAGGTPYGCYKQALRELWKRLRGLRELYVQERLLEIDLDELGASSPIDPFEVRRREVHRWSKRLQMDELRKNIAETEREFLHFYKQAAALKTAVGALEAGRRAQLDREMWEHRLRAMAAIDFMTTGRLSTNTIEAIRACPDPMRERLIEQILAPSRHARLIDEFLSERPELPAASLPLDFEVRKLVQCCE